MWGLGICVLIAFLVNPGSGFQRDADPGLCGNATSRRAQACVNQIFGPNHVNLESCTINIPYPNNSDDCKQMYFAPVTSNLYSIGHVKLEPSIILIKNEEHTFNQAVLNITFANIKWKTMKFRFQQKKNKTKNHCRDIVISNDVTINDRSVLYYDCYWSPSVLGTTQSYILDFEARDDKVVNNGQFLFNVPTALMLSDTVKEEEWIPFLYIEMVGNGYVTLHINRPRPHLNITGYEIMVKQEVDNDAKNIANYSVIKLTNEMEETTYDYSIYNANGLYYFSVTPLHTQCEMSSKPKQICQTVESPRIHIQSDHVTTICIASYAAMAVSALFALFVVMWYTRHKWCQDKYKLADFEIPPPTKVLVINATDNGLHKICVTSFVSVLRSAYGFHVMYEDDIAMTNHRDPHIWADDAYSQASHVIYVVGPKQKAYYDHVYCEKPLTNVYPGLDQLLLNRLPVDGISSSKKQIANVFFDYSDGEIPSETKHAVPFFLIKDWQKMIACLSKNLLPRQEIRKTEQGKTFLDDVAKAKKLMNEGAR